MGKMVVTDRAGVTHEIEIAAGDNLMEPLRELDDGIEALCGGMCSCATCHIVVAPEFFAKLEPAQDDELELLEPPEEPLLPEDPDEPELPLEPPLVLPVDPPGCTARSHLRLRIGELG